MECSYYSKRQMMCRCECEASDMPTRCCLTYAIPADTLAVGLETSNHVTTLGSTYMVN